jgi:hypothetical protein
MTMLLLFRTVTALLCIGVASAFAPNNLQETRRGVETSLQASSSKEDGDFLADLTGRTAAASLAVAAAIFANVAVAAEPVGAHGDLGASSQVIAARSGGRAGGRAAARSAAPPPRSSSRTVIRETIVRPSYSPGVIVTPGIGFGYNPLGGFGLGYGLGAAGSIGDSYRDYRQEGEIQQNRAELSAERQKSAELEARLRALEQAQVQQGAK